MSSVISKWVLPGLITTVVGTATTVMFTQNTIEQDLVAKSSEVVNLAGIEDAAVSFDARDGRITGISTSSDAADSAVTQVAGLHGVRSIASDITLAPTVSPYPFSAVLSESGLALSGGVPSYALRDALLEQTGGTDAGLELMSGAPSGDWLATTSLAVSQLDGLESGEATLSDLSMSVSGIAKSSEGFQSTNASLMAALPNNIVLANSSLQAPFVEDYTFSATRLAGETVLSGHVPDEATRTKIGELSGASTADLVLASGAPTGFLSSVTYGLSALGHLSDGEVNVTKTEVSVSGTAADTAEFNMAKALLAAAPVGANVVLAEITPPAPIVVPTPAVAEIVAPTVAPAPYFWSVQKRGDGSVTIRGFVPDETTRTAIMARAGKGAIDRMQIQENAPATFYEDALVSISAVKELGAGRAGFTRGAWFLSGQPTSVDAKVAADSALNTARTFKGNWNINLDAAPAVKPYILIAEKVSANSVVLSGYVPDDATRAAIVARAGEGAVDNMITANGAPTHFYEDALVSISSLKELSWGRAGHSASGWFLVGDPATQTASDNATTGLNTARTMANAWYVSLADAPPVPVVPYAWSAAKTADGALIVSGNVPDDATRTAIMARAGEGAIDNMQIGFGAPATFYEDALVAISAVKELESGRTGNGGGGWYLAGQPATDEAKAAATNSLLAARTHANNWSVSVADTPLVPVIPYTWSVSKSAKGSLMLSGNIPDEATRAAIMARAGEGAIDDMVVSYGAPETFYEDALVAISAAKELEEGRSGLSGSGWFLFGTTNSNDTREAATGALLTARTHADNWYVSIPEHEEPAIEEATTETTPQAEIMMDNNFEAKLSQDGGIALSGMVPSNKSRTYLGQISGGVLTSNVVVSPRGTPDAFAENARSGIRSLHRLTEGRLAYEGGIWSLVGKAVSANARADALSQIKGLANYSEWQTDIKLPTWAEICQTQVTRLASENSIQFTTASAVITDDSLLDLQDMAVFLRQCKDAKVHVEGHTDSQGDFTYNLKLSSDRAESIVAALIGFGIEESRLYSIGYGEDRPIASNDTEEGRQANRRIVFKVLD